MTNLLQDIDAEIDELEGKVAEAQRARDEAQETVEIGSVRLADLHQAREILARSDNGSQAKPSPKKKAGRPRRSSPPAQRGPAKDSTPKAKSPAKPEPGPSSPKAAAALERQDRIIEHIAANPGCTGSEIAKALKIPAPVVSQIGSSLVRQKKIHRERDGYAKRHYTGQAKAGRDVAESEPKTGLEQRVVDACGADGATDRGIAAAANIDTHVARQVASTLVRRRALVREGELYRRPSHPRTMADRA